MLGRELARTPPPPLVPPPLCLRSACRTSTRAQKVKRLLPRHARLSTRGAEDTGCRRQKNAAHALLHTRCSGRARPHLRTPSTQLLDGHWSGASQVQVRCRTQPGRHLSNPSHQDAREGGDLRRHQHQATLDCRPLSPGGGARGRASTPTCVRACLGSCPRRGAQGQ